MSKTKVFEMLNMFFIGLSFYLCQLLLVSVITEQGKSLCESFKNKLCSTTSMEVKPRNSTAKAGY